MGKCSVEGCDKKYRSLGYCQNHYMQMRRRGDPLYRTKKKVCTVEGCNKRHVGGGLCRIHYTRNRVHGNPLIVMSRKKQECEIDDCKATVHGQGYCALHYRKLMRYGHPLFDIKHAVSISTKEQIFRIRAREKAQKHFKGIKLFCVINGCKNKNIILHHEDYDFPIDVIPLCRGHHSQRHAEIRRGKFYNNLKEQEVTSSLVN